MASTSPLCKTNLSALLLFLSFKTSLLGISLAVHWLRLRAPNAGGLTIPGQGTVNRSLMPHTQKTKTKVNLTYLLTFSLLHSPILTQSFIHQLLH